MPQGRCTLPPDEGGRILDRLAGLDQVIPPHQIGHALASAGRSNPRSCPLTHEVVLRVVLAMGVLSDLPIRQVFKHARRLRADEASPGRPPPSPPPTAAIFPPRRREQWDQDAEVASTREKGRGRVEARTLATSTWLNEYRADWPGLAQVFRLTRERTARGVTTVEVVYGLTSLTRSEATAEDVLDFTRAHWGIESGLHSVRDVTLGEDECRVRRGQSARVLASLRNVAIHLLRREDDPNLAATTRRLAAFPHQAVAMITTPASISA